MSGGSYGYIYNRINDELVGHMRDKELDIMMGDLAEVLHDLEWWVSSDISERDYRETVAKFKKKYFSTEERVKNLQQIIETETTKLKQELLQMLGVNNE